MPKQSRPRHSATRSGKTLRSFTLHLLVAAVKLDLFTQMLFMGRRKKTKYLARTFFHRAHQV